jgi:phosphoribosylformimino-5-aminoimidazole carboxamide ribotide isomerase
MLPRSSAKRAPKASTKEANPRNHAALFAFYPKSSQRLADRHTARYSGASPPGEFIKSRAGITHVIIYPAIDLRGGQCVRLRQGDYAQETVFDADPVSVARRWVEQGAEYLHLVDLDGAREGRPVNGACIQAIVEAVGVPCQLGGGLRHEDHIEVALRWGVARVILGTRALREPEWAQSMAQTYRGQIALGIDARDGWVAAQGWLETSEVSAVALARRCAGWPLAALVYTDISKDGMLEGPNVEATAEVAAAVHSLPVIASGGVTTLDDVARLARRRLAGCIIGRALYEGRLDLAAAIALARKESSSPASIAR